MSEHWVRRTPVHFLVEPQHDVTCPASRTSSHTALKYGGRPMQIRPRPIAGYPTNPAFGRNDAWRTAYAPSRWHEGLCVPARGYPWFVSLSRSSVARITAVERSTATWQSLPLVDGAVIRRRQDLPKRRCEIASLIAAGLQVTGFLYWCPAWRRKRRLIDHVRSPDSGMTP